ncbi:Ion channel TACAN/TMEM120B - like 1 [Theobroma cacao]|nr:Ion channel TACAN/TMEM120B - like 1 [Theobroma cacao]
MEAVDESANKVEEEVGRVVEQARELQESGASLISRISNEEQSLRQKANSLESSIRRLQDLLRARCIITDGDAAAFLPAKAQGRFLRMFLGPINVRASRKDVQLKVKEEYNSYRILDLGRMLACISSSVVPGMVAVPLHWFGFARKHIESKWKRYSPMDVKLTKAQCGREFRNLSPVDYFDELVHSMWIYHHYCAMVMALVSLTWEIKGQPNCAQKQRGVELFLQWAMMQGVAMLLQNRYQRQRLYTRIALGKVANRMDVVWGETAGVDGQLWVLCPILFLMQGFEAYVGLLLLNTAFVGVVSEWQVIFCGILLVLMAVGNFMNTVQTLMAKSRFKAKMKRTKSKQELDYVVRNS